MVLRAVIVIVCVGTVRLAFGQDAAVAPARSENARAWIRVLPVAGVVGEDFFLGPFFDRNGMRGQSVDFTGGDRTYDGHPGTDFGLPTFEEMDVGVPVVAVAAGKIMSVIDRHPDRETNLDSGRMGNTIGIDHGDGRRTYYRHLRKNSSTVRVGQRVRAGQQIALVGSSGNSTGPHLHFEVSVDRRKVDPFAPTDRANESLWAVQPKYHYPTKAIDAGLLLEELNNLERPEDLPRASFARSDARGIGCWVRLLQEQAGLDRRWELMQGNRTIHRHWKSTTSEATNVQHTWWWMDQPDLTRGRWKFRIFHNDQLEAEIPFLVLDPRVREPRNQPPKCPKIALLPAEPVPNQAVSCRVTHPGPAADPNLHPVRYRYVWTLAGRELRRVISATHLDYFPADVATPDDTLQCEVSVGDSHQWSRVSEESVRYGSADQ